VVLTFLQGQYNICCGGYVCLSVFSVLTLGWVDGRASSHSGLCNLCWLHGTAVERRSMAGELSLFCAQSVADGKPFAIGQPTRPTQPFIPLGSINE